MDASETNTEQKSPGGSDSTWQRFRWFAALRWFAAEFLVVVSGVLVALALQASYQSHQDAAAERVYLTQLDADLLRTEQTFQQALNQDRERETANTNLLAALYRPDALEATSARVWFHVSMGWYSDPRPILGIVDTLIATGDIKLIRDPQMRSQIMAYASLVDMDMTELSRSADRLARANDAERERFERIGLPPVADYSEAQMTALLPRYEGAWKAMKSDADLRLAYQIRLIAYSNRIYYLDRLRTATAELRTALHGSVD
jgi:hypothetical protein